MNGVFTVVPSPRVKVAGAVASVWKGLAHGSFRWIALTRTMRVSFVIAFDGRSGSIVPPVFVLTQSLIAVSALDGFFSKSSTYTPVP